MEERKREHIRIETPITDALEADPSIERRDVPWRAWRQMAQLEVERTRLIEALKPFSQFVFGQQWVGHRIVSEQGDVEVLAGYAADGARTNIDVRYSDFEHARALLKELQ